MNVKILCVDDDESILNAYRRTLRKQFRLETAPSGEEALRLLSSDGPYAVIISDLRMPGLDGIQLLARAKVLSPESVRIMLTGCSDQQTAIDAINEGSIFRFLTKPCTPAALASAIAAGLEQHQLITAERELLGKTLRGTIKVLTDVLSLVNPAAFGRATRVLRLVRGLAAELNIFHTWEVEMAAMLSRIGYVTLPPETTEKLYRGIPLSAEEADMLARHPAIGRDLVANIPRLEGVAEIIRLQDAHFEEVPTLPVGARILKVAFDFDALRRGAMTDEEALACMRERPGWYDPEVLAALSAAIGLDEALEVRAVNVMDLNGQMVFAEDVYTVNNVLVVSRGQEVTPVLCQRLRNYSRHTRIREPIRVFVRTDRSAAAPVPQPATSWR